MILIYILCRYEFEYFSFFDIAVLFSAGNAKKNVFTVFTVPIVTIDVLSADFYQIFVWGFLVGQTKMSGPKI